MGSEILHFSNMLALAAFLIWVIWRVFWFAVFGLNITPWEGMQLWTRSICAGMSVGFTYWILSCYEKFLDAFQTAGLSELGVAAGPLAAAILPGFVTLTVMKDLWEISARSIVDLRKAWWRVPACIISVTGSALACAYLLFAVVK